MAAKIPMTQVYKKIKIEIKSDIPTIFGVKESRLSENK